jgi:hypothetical protein
MPRIKGYDPQVSPVGPVGGQRATGASIAPGVAALGEAADRRERALKQREISNATVKLSESQALWEQNTDDLLKTSQPGDDITPKFIEDFDKGAESLYEGVSSPEGQMFVRENVARLKTHFLNKVQGGQAALAGAAAVENHRKSLQSDAGALLKNPDGFGIALERRNTKIAGDVAAGLIGPVDALTLQRTDAQELAVAAMNGRIDIAGRLGEAGTAKGTAAALAALETARGQVGDGPLAKHIDADTQAVLLNRIDGERNRILAEQDRKARETQADARALVSDNFQDTLASIELNGKDPGLISPALIRQAYGEHPEHAARLIAQIENAKAAYNTRQSVALTAPADDVKVLQEQAAAAPGANATQKARQLAELQRAVAAKHQALREDPFAYLISVSPDLAKEGAAAQLSNDPGEFRAFLSKVDALQAQVGVPDYARRFMGKDGASAFVAQVNLMPAEQAADQMEILREQYGERWPQVMTELVQADINPSFATLARLTDGADAGVRKDLAAALQTGHTELKKNVGADATTIEDEVFAEMADFAETMQYDGPAGQRTLAGERVSATLLAYSYVQRGEAPKVAARKAVAALLHNRYDYVETYRTPKGLGGHVMQMTSLKQARLTPEQFPMANTGVAGLSDDYRRRANWQYAKDGVWANVNGGVELLYPDGSPVVLNDGSRVRVMFDEQAPDVALPAGDPAAELRMTPR